MAANLERALVRTLTSSQKTPFRRKPAFHELQWRRAISSTAPLRANSPISDAERAREELVVKNLVEIMKQRPGSERDRMREAQRVAEYDMLPPDPNDRISNYAKIIQNKARRGGEGPFDLQANEEEPLRESEVGFWAEGEKDQGTDDDYFADDISSVGHTELDTHREIREYARLAAWELPLLSKFAQPFEAPTQPLRFRYTTYLGEEHPAAHKVVVQFFPTSLGLSDRELRTFLKLCGPRFSLDTQAVKISCEQFDTQMQNKRWLLDTINALIKEAKEGQDTFEDIPFDFRHHKPKPQYEFPEEWIMTEERKKQLAEKRSVALLEEQKLVESGKVLDGKKIVSSSLSPGAEDAEMAMIEAPTWYTGRRRFRRV